MRLKSFKAGEVWPILAQALNIGAWEEFHGRTARIGEKEDHCTQHEQAAGNGCCLRKAKQIKQGQASPF